MMTDKVFTVEMLDKENLTKEQIQEVILHNMKVVDKLLNVKLMVYATLSYFKTNKGKTFVDLEKLLRQHNMNTHLYAHRGKLLQKGKLSIPYNTEEKTLLYECFFSCRPKELAIREVCMMWGSLERNLIELNGAGMFFFCENDFEHIDVKEGEVRKLADGSIFIGMKGDQLCELIHHCKVIIIEE